MDTRTLTVSIDDTPQQTRAILRQQAALASGTRLEVDTGPFVALQRWLELAGERRVIVPFAGSLAEGVPAELVRMRRDFPQLLTVIQAVALPYQQQRQRDGEGRIVATLDDYRMARDLLEDVFTATATGGVSPTVRETVEAVRELYDGRAPLTAKQVGDHLGLPRNTAFYRVGAARDLGYLVNLETRRGHPAQLVPGDPLPKERPALPEPSALASACAQDRPEATRTVEPHSAGRSYGESTGAVQDTVQQPLEPPIEPSIEPSEPSTLASRTGHTDGSVQRFNADREEAGESVAPVETCGCGGELVAYTPAGRPVCQRHRQPDDACSACGSRDYWARKDGGWVCSRCHPVPSPDSVLEIVMVGSA